MTVGEGRIETGFTRLMGVRYPIVGAPMYFVSTPRLVAAVSNAGGLGAFPSLNFRSPDLLLSALAEVRSLTGMPYGVNLIVNQSNPYRQEHARICLEAGVPLLITSLGSPRELIADAHRGGTKVFCDVVDLGYALKVQDLGADGVVAVGAGAGGHAGRTVLQVLVPQLKGNLSIPVLAAGGIATGRGLLAALSLGADGAYVGTRFVASEEAEVSEAYKKAVLDCGPEDILYTARVTGVHANFIKTPGLAEKGPELLWPEKMLLRFPPTKRLARGLRLLAVDKKMARSAKGGPQKPWRDIWSAGQGVGLVHEIKPAAEIITDMIAEYEAARLALPPLV
jgi:nitronate monooxygenase